MCSEESYNTSRRKITVSTSGYIQGVKQLIEDEIRTVVANFEPRANILNVTVESDRDGAGYQIKIIFSVVNETEPITFTTFLESTRGI